MIRSFEFTREMQRENLCSEFKVSPFLQINHLNVVRLSRITKGGLDRRKQRNFVVGTYYLC